MKCLKQRIAIHIVKYWLHGELLGNADCKILLNIGASKKWDTNQGVHRNLPIPLERHHKTQWNPSISNLMLTNIQSLKPKIDVILHYILEHKLDICFITETWISKMKTCNT